MYDMINIFEIFLPQLLRYPNPTDPLNGEAAALLLREPKHYDIKVKGMCANKVRTCVFMLTLNIEYVQKYANKDVLDAGDDESESDEEMSSVGSYDSEEEDPAGTMEV